MFNKLYYTFDNDPKQTLHSLNVSASAIDMLDHIIDESKLTNLDQEAIVCEIIPFLPVNELCLDELSFTVVHVEGMPLPKRIYKNEMALIELSQMAEYEAIHGDLFRQVYPKCEDAEHALLECEEIKGACPVNYSNIGLSQAA